MRRRADPGPSGSRTARGAGPSTVPRGRPPGASTSGRTTRPGRPRPPPTGEVAGVRHDPAAVEQVDVAADLVALAGVRVVPGLDREGEPRSGDGAGPDPVDRPDHALRDLRGHDLLRPVRGGREPGLRVVPVVAVAEPVEELHPQRALGVLDVHVGELHERRQRTPAAGPAGPGGDAERGADAVPLPVVDRDLGEAPGVGVALDQPRPQGGQVRRVERGGPGARDGETVRGPGDQTGAADRGPGPEHGAPRHRVGRGGRGGSRGRPPGCGQGTVREIRCHSVNMSHSSTQVSISHAHVVKVIVGAPQALCGPVSPGRPGSPRFSPRSACRRRYQA